MSRMLLWLGVWHAVYFFLKKPKRILWLIFTLPFIISAISFAIELYFASNENEILSSPPEITANSNEKPKNPNDPQYIMQKSSNVAMIPPFVGRMEDGNSVFNVGLASTMSGNDYNFYSSHFRYAMSYFAAEKQYLWLINNQFFGYFTAGEPFKAKSGITCREFSEKTHYHGKNQKFSGYACKRNDGGWCKLRYKSSLSCNIGTSSPTSIFWRNKINGIFSGI